MCKERYREAATNVHIIEDFQYIRFQAALGVVFIFTCSSPRQSSIVTLLGLPAVFAQLSSVRLLIFFSWIILSHLSSNCSISYLLPFPLWCIDGFPALNMADFFWGVSLYVLTANSKFKMRDTGRWQQKFMSSKIFVILFSGSSGPLGVVFVRVSMCCCCLRATPIWLLLFFSWIIAFSFLSGPQAYELL